jgi:hypothetical protein
MSYDIPAGRDLDVLVHRAWMGGDVAVIEGEPLILVDPAEGAPYPVPQYSTLIQDAMLLVDRLRRDLLRPVLMPDWGHQWQCVIYRQDKFLAQSGFLVSLPEAIVRAAMAFHLSVYGR